MIFHGANVCKERMKHMMLPVHNSEMFLKLINITFN